MLAPYSDVHISYKVSIDLRAKKMSLQVDSYQIIIEVLKNFLKITVSDFNLGEFHSKVQSPIF